MLLSNVSTWTKKETWNSDTDLVTLYLFYLHKGLIALYGTAGVKLYVINI